MVTLPDGQPSPSAADLGRVADAALAVDGVARRALDLARTLGGSVARCVYEAPGQREPDQIALAHLCALDLVRQHHAERDHAALGRLLLDAGRTPW